MDLAKGLLVIFFSSQAGAVALVGGVMVGWFLLPAKAQKFLPLPLVLLTFVLMCAVYAAFDFGSRY